MSRPAARRAGREARPATICAIGPGGWAVAERSVDYATTMLVEQAADELRSGVRSETGWTPRMVVLDDRGRDVTADYRVN